ncbi:MAG: hypothetical protein JXA74_11965 [Anaerolineae bacterium]|nr:hypothetical protein [Anaerolineae bacterium]
MYTLSNDQLTVSILDPVADVARMGSRYCTGGYIWQVTDGRLGELLAGPRYPDPNPDAFNGQGAPEMFMAALGEDAPLGGLVGCIGVGAVRRTSSVEPFSVRHNPEVAEFLRWDVEVEEAAITMYAHGRHGGWGYGLERLVTLTERTLVSQTTLENRGVLSVPIRWFPHPFFPPTVDGVQCRFATAVTLPENPGFQMEAEGWIRYKPEHDWGRGCFQALGFDAPEDGLRFVQKHPKVGQVAVETDYVPAYLPIWGNANTFSVEPYHEDTLSEGEAARWSVTYRF